MEDHREGERGREGEREEERGREGDRERGREEERDMNAIFSGLKSVTHSEKQLSLNQKFQHLDSDAERRGQTEKVFDLILAVTKILR